MSNLPQQNSEQRRISNLPPNQTADHTIDNNENNRDVQMTIKNGPDYQIKVNNLEESPAPLSSEPIISTPNQNQALQSNHHAEKVRTGPLPASRIGFVLSFPAGRFSLLTHT